MHLQMSLWVINLLIMLFELRILMQFSNADYYSPFTQTVLKITNPIVNLPGLRSLTIGRMPLGGLIVSWAIAFVFWLILVQFGSFFYPALFSLMMVVKCFGYLLIALMIAQALTSWLPATQSWCLLFAQLTAPIVNPVRRIVPPIGMIDISLMIILFLLWALNAVITKMLFAIDRTLGSIWVFI